jgi:hypothetical protein
VSDRRAALTVAAAGGKATTAGDMAKGGWSGAYSKNIPDTNYPNGIVAAVASKYLGSVLMLLTCPLEGMHYVQGWNRRWNDCCITAPHCCLFSPAAVFPALLDSSHLGHTSQKV